MGEDENERLIGTKVSKTKMYEKIIRQMDKVKRIFKASDKLFMYAENYVYCPSQLKLLESTKTKDK